MWGFVQCGWNVDLRLTIIGSSKLLQLPKKLLILWCIKNNRTMQSFGSGRCDIASNIFCITGDVWYSLVCLSGQGINLIQITCFSVQILDILSDLAEWNLFLRLPLEPQNIFIICKNNYTQPLKKCNIHILPDFFHILHFSHSFQTQLFHRFFCKPPHSDVVLVWKILPIFWLWEDTRWNVLRSCRS